MSEIKIIIQTNEIDSFQIDVQKSKEFHPIKALIVVFFSFIITIIVYQLMNPATKSHLIFIGLWISCIILLSSHFYNKPKTITLKGEKSKGLEIINGSSIEFIEKKVLRDIIIHEQIQQFKVVNYLALTFNSDVAEYQTKYPPLKPIFHEFDLSMKDQQLIYQKVHSFLTE